ncbi:chromosome segregation protein SMC [Betaproteobacteria bacterium PRO7]|jgi:energy-coupling factor transporter ATP-binding protein EcfA2|nr:chromosome segregation protein SMC [Betaproteobacteria bacterium PRO7]
MLQSVRIQRFKRINDVEIPLGRVTLLVGPNNAGKSSVLHAVQFAVSVAQSLRLDNTANWVEERLAGTLSSQQLVYSPLRDVQALAAGGVLRQDENQAIRITLLTDDLGTAVVTVRRGKNKNIAVSIDGRQCGQRLEQIDQPYSVVAPGLAGIPAFEEYRSAGIVRRAAARGDANSVFRNILWVLRQDANAWESFSANMATIFSEMSIDVQFDVTIDEHISATIETADSYLPIDSCGTGVLQAVQTLAYIDVYRPRLLILDEPDSHLHPDNQRKLARLLSHLAETRDFQVLISTHSRHLLDEFSKLGATVHWFSGGSIHPDNTDRVAVLLGLGALDTGDRLRNGATPFIALTEDGDDEILRRILSSSGLGDEKCEVWSYSGCTNIQAALVLAQFIREHAPNTKIVVHRDRDFMTDQEVDEYRRKLAAAGIEAFITTGTDIESHLLDPQHLSTIAQSMPTERIAEIVNEVTAETRELSIERMTNSLIKAAQARRNREGGAEPNYGAIAQEARARYDADPVRYRVGKLVLGRVAARLQHELGRNVRCAQDSAALRVPELVQLANA